MMNFQAFFEYIENPNKEKIYSSNKSIKYKGYGNYYCDPNEESFHIFRIKNHGKDLLEIYIKANERKRSFPDSSNQRFDECSDIEYSVLIYEYDREDKHLSRDETIEILSEFFPMDDPKEPDPYC